MLKRIDELLSLNVDFAIETTLTTISYTDTIETAKRNGYNVTLLYFWLNVVELAIERVRNRVKEGGHNIPEEIIRRRYKKGISNLINIFISSCNYWLIIDNSRKQFIFVTEGIGSNELVVYNTEIWRIIKEKANG